MVHALRKLKSIWETRKMYRFKKQTHTQKNKPKSVKTRTTIKQNITQCQIPKGIPSAENSKSSWHVKVIKKNLLKNTGLGMDTEGREALALRHNHLQRLRVSGETDLA